ncbi:hypothetical protein [Citrobacter cronae]|uniref:hypothetical protein n=1 Tax=Citrobacter cronae TaxID=1748967 RepID=UPI0021D3A577|nr:hypothetical protein [Citrobacter cronae]
MKPTYEELEQQVLELSVQLANAESKCRELAAENATKQEFIATCFRAAADGGSMDGAEIQELGERLGLFGRETYQPVLHGYICGHEAGEDTVYVMKKSPATDDFLAEVRAQGVELFASSLKVVGGREHPYSAVANEFAAQLRKGAAL